jgi:riboflavin kinase/FMN adenylyltransferase
MEALGLQLAVLIDFSENFSKLRGSEFLDLLERRGRMAFLAIGSNFRCGFRQDMGADQIRERNERNGIPTELIGPVKFESETVSSSRVRSAVLSGDLKTAAALIGRNVELDFSDLKPESPVDLNSVHRIAPISGQYSVLIHPGGRAGQVKAENGKLFLLSRSHQERADGETGYYSQNCPVESLEFII